MTQITVKQLAAAKRTAMNVLPLTNKKDRLNAKMAAMNQEIAELEQQIDLQQGYVKSFAGGLTTEQLLIRNENKAFEANPDVLYFDEEKRVYVVKEPEELQGSDFDADKAAAEAVAPTAEEIAAVEQARLESEAEAAAMLGEENAPTENAPAEEVVANESIEEDPFA